MIEIPLLDHRDEGLWNALLDLAERVPGGWTLVGGQMVRLLGLVHGAQQPRASTDIDLVADLRANPKALTMIGEALRAQGLSPPDAALAADVGHRFVRDDVVVDVLAPDNMGGRASLRTLGSATTLEVGGGTYALSRSGPVDVRIAGREGTVFLPDLAGSLVIKAVAAARDRGRRGPDRHLSDLAFMLTLVEDAIELRAILGAKNCRRIGDVAPLNEADHEAWRALGSRTAAVGQRNLLLIRAGTR